MKRIAATALFLGAAALGACRQDLAPAPDAAETGDRPAISAATPSSPPSPDVSTRPDQADDRYPDLAPPVLTPEAERGVTGARNLLVSWARAIELEEFGQAWTLLSEQDRAKWTRQEWLRMFADLDRITVAVPEGTMQGAAGSLYYESPVTITATDHDGRPVRYEGEAVLRRVNDVEGATAAQLRWHFERLTLDWTH